MKAILAIQCTAPNGQIGSWLFTRNVNGNRDLVSPVFQDTYDFYRWAQANGWNAVYDKNEPTGAYAHK